MMPCKPAEVLGAWSSLQETLPSYTYLPEEIPHPANAEAPRRRQMRRRLSTFRTLPVTCWEIQEMEEEGASATDEEKARRTFLQSLESLRRSTQNLHLQQRERLNSSSSSADSGDSDSAL